MTAPEHWTAQDDAAVEVFCDYGIVGNQTRADQPDPPDEHDDLRSTLVIVALLAAVLLYLIGLMWIAGAIVGAITGWPTWFAALIVAACAVVITWAAVSDR